MSSRNLGNNYSLALNTGNGTHLTILYIKNCKRGLGFPCNAKFLNE